MKRDIVIGFILSAIILAITGCGQPVIPGQDVIGPVPITDDVLKSINTDNRGGLEKEIERLKVGNYEIRLIDNKYLYNQYCFIFSAYDKDRRITYVWYSKKNEKDMQEIRAYMKMNSIDKKNFIRNSFITYAHFDLGPVEVTELQKENKPSTAAGKVPTTIAAPSAK